MEALLIGDYHGMTVEDVIKDVADEYEVSESEVSQYNILVAFSEVGGYEGYGYFVLEKDGDLYENHSSHCSCYGMEGQWGPEPTNLTYLLDPNRRLAGYYGRHLDDQIRDHLSKLRN